MTSQREPVGTLAEEAARLLEAVQEWAGRAVGDGVPLSGEDPECRVCPVCMMLRAVRGVRPETVEHLVEATGSLAAALRSMVDPGAHHEHPRPQPGPVQRIDIQ